MKSTHSRQRKPVVVVTGAAAGIGAAIAVELLNDGFLVVGVDRSKKGFSKVPRKFARRVVAVEGDTSDRATHQHARKAAEELGKLVGWVNNAGIERPTRAHDFAEPDFEAMFRVNLHGYVFGCAEACQSFIANKIPGAIVNVSSIRSVASFPSGFIYETTKGGVDAMTRQVAVEYGHLGIRCNAVRPGCIMTPMTQAEVDGAKDKQAFLTELGNLHPLQRRIGTPEEVSAVVAFLMSAKASFISGECIAVDGGATARCYPYPPDPAIQFPAAR